MTLYWYIIKLKDRGEVVDAYICFLSVLLADQTGLPFTVSDRVLGSGKFRNRCFDSTEVKSSLPGGEEAYE